MPHKDSEARKEYQKQYYLKNKERLDEAHKQWREENTEVIRGINVRASKKYRDKVREKLKVIQPDLATSLQNIGDNDK